MDERLIILDWNSKYWGNKIKKLRKIIRKEENLL